MASDIKPITSDVTREFDYAEKPKLSPGWQLARDIGETIILTLLMFLVIRLAVQDYQVDGTSMLPTLQNTQFVLVDKLTYAFNSPQRGDIIVFEYPLDHTQNYIKRIIGVPGDVISITDKVANGINISTVSVNGQVLDEPYINDQDNPYGPETYVLKPGQYFVLGDNRGGSSDSRDWGPVDRSLIIGKAELVYWPLSALHFLPNEHSVFAGVPQSNGAVPSVTPGGPVSDGRAVPAGSLLFLTMLPIAGTAVLARRRLRDARR